MKDISKRTAIARIVSDLIRSDNIVDESEMNVLDEIEEEYGIQPKHLIAAQLISFTEAIEVLRENSDVQQTEKLLHQLKRVAEVDGACTRQEALLLTATQYCLSAETMNSSTLLSCESDGIIGTNNNFVLYIESDEDDDINSDFHDERTFHAIVGDMRLNGFDFIYIPSMLKEFRQKSPDYIKKVITYMSPNLTEEFVQQIYNKILSISTSSFTNDLLYKKMNIKVSNTEPALLVNIGTSLVPYCGGNNESKTYTEFLKINITGNIYDEITQLIRIYNSFVSVADTPSIISSRNKLKYFGFYKALLDLMVFTKSDSDIRINIFNKKETIKFIDTNESPKLKPNEAALYCLIIRQTLLDDVNHGLLISPNTKQRQELNLIYNKLYCAITGSDTDKDYSQGIAQAISHIRKSIKDLQLLRNKDDFMPIKDIENGVYTVKLRSETLKVYDVVSSIDKTMDLSDFWTNV